MYIHLTFHSLEQAAINIGTIPTPKISNKADKEDRKNNNIKI